MSGELSTGSASTGSASTGSASTGSASTGSAATLRDAVDPLLFRAFGVSLVLHLVLLAFGPVPSTTAVPLPPIALEVILPPMPGSETGTGPVSEPAADAPAEPQPEPVPERTPDPQPDPEAAEVTPRTLLPPADPQPEPAPEPTPEAPAEVDPDAVARLLEATIAHQQDEARKRVELRYQLHVREMVRVALEPEHPELSVSQSRSGLPSFRLSFRVDREGYLLDLSLRRAPGTPSIPAGMRRALLALSPLDPPPRSIDGVLELTFFIEFL